MLCTKFFSWNGLRANFFSWNLSYACFSLRETSMLIVFLVKREFIHGTCCVLIFVHGACCLLFFSWNLLDGDFSPRDTCTFIFSSWNWFCSMKLLRAYFCLWNLLQVEFFSWWKLSIDFSPLETDFVPETCCVLILIRETFCMKFFFHVTRTIIILLINFLFLTHIDYVV